MSVRSSGNQLVALTRELMRHWEQTKSHWQDTQGRSFEADYLEPLQVQVTATVAALEKLDGLITKIENDCE